MQRYLENKIKNNLLDEVEISVIVPEDRIPNPRISFLTLSAYIKFKCPKCKSKSWSTGNGTVDFRYSMDLVPTPLLMFRLRIYRQKCKKCLRFGIPHINDQQCREIYYDFQSLINQILDGEKVPRRKGRTTKFGSHEGNHIKDLCEACDLKKCVYSPQKAKKQRQKRKYKEKIVAADQS